MPGPTAGRDMEQQAPMKAPKDSRSRTEETRRGVYILFLDDVSPINLVKAPIEIFRVSLQYRIRLVVGIIFRFEKKCILQKLETEE